MKRNTPFFNIGTNSILTIFVLLCMVTLATLSFLTVRKDGIFQEKELQRKADYCQASNEAQKKIAQIDESLKAAWQEGRYEQVEKTYTFDVDIDENFILSVELVTCIPEENDGHFYRVTRYQEIMRRKWQGDDTVDLIEFE